jgi:GAF domain-containing protein
VVDLEDLSALHDHHVVSGVSIIIHGPGRSFGVLGAHSTRRQMFSADGVHFLQAIASVLGTVLERKGAEEALAAGAAFLRVQTSVAQAASSTADGDEGLQRCTEYNDPIDLLLTNVVMPG